MQLISRANNGVVFYFRQKRLSEESAGRPNVELVSNDVRSATIK
jgi:hypothetical protein